MALYLISIIWRNTTISYEIACTVQGIILKKVNVINAAFLSKQNVFAAILTHPRITLVLHVSLFQNGHNIFSMFACASSNDSDQPVHPRRLISLRKAKETKRLQAHHGNTLI